MAQVVPVFTTICPKARRSELDAPWNRLAAGWRDRRRAPQVSLACGIVPLPPIRRATRRALVPQPR